jgi:membrane protein DedA with SNARE-associated domain
MNGPSCGRPESLCSAVYSNFHVGGNFFIECRSINERRIFPMNVVDLIQGYGYAAVAAGAFLEGEASLALGGFAAYRGHLALPEVIMVATIATFLGDQLYFHLGRRYGTGLLARFPSMQSRAARAKVLLQRHHLPLMLSIRFMYGLRTPGLIAMGMCNVSPFRFFALSLVTAALWALGVVGAGYVFGHAMGQLLANLAYYQLWLAGALLLCGSIWFLLARRARAGRISADPDNR